MSASTNDKYAFLVEKLYEDTSRGKMPWRISERNLYSTPIGENYIELSSKERNGDTDIYVYIMDKDGNVLDSFSDVDLADAMPRILGFNSYFSLMFDLLRRVGRRASGAEDVLDNILRGLGASPAQVPTRQLKSKDDEIPF
jgi:hypothetical protein